MTDAADGKAQIIDTGRLLLRGHRTEDLDAYAALWADPVVVRFIGGRAFTREEAWVRILRYAGSWPLMGFGFWAIEDKASGRLLGEAGFHELRRAIEPSFEGTPEAGWMIAPSAHGKGYATEVVTAIHAWGDRHLGTASTVCIIDPGNAASLRVADRAGYREETRTSYHGKPSIILRRYKTSP